MQLFGQSVREQPLLCSVGDPERVLVRNMPQFIDASALHRDLSFESELGGGG